MTQIPTGNRWLLPALLAVVFAVYAPALSNGFALDDRAVAESVLPATGAPNPNIREFQPPWHYFQRSYWEPAITGDGLYRPVTVWSFGWTYQFFGAFLPPQWEGFPQHLLNVILHVLGTWLVLRMMLSLGMPYRWALIPAACFGLHALHSEAVVGIVGRAELLAFCFGAASLLAFLRPGWKSGALSALALFFALCSKESAIAWVGMLPCFVLARGWISADAQGLSGAQIRRGLAISGSAILLWLPLWWSIQSGATNQLPPYGANDLAYMSTGERMLTGIALWGFGLWKCVFPGTLISLYGPEVFPGVISLGDTRFLAAGAALGALLVSGLLLARRRPTLFLSAAWFFGFSVLTANLLFPIGTNFGERLYYTPVLGVCLLPLLGFRHDREPPRLLLGILGAYLLVHAYWIVERNGDWRDDATLARHDAALQPRSLSLLRIAAGTYLAGPRPDLGKARALLEQAVACNDHDPLAWKMLADLELQENHPDQAIAAFRKVLASRYATTAGDARSLALTGIGEVHRRGGKNADAMESYRQALALQPRNVLAQVGIGRVLLQQGQGPAAIQAFQDALAIRPDDQSAWIELASHAPGVLPKSKLQELFTLGQKTVGHRPSLALLVGGMGYRAGLDPRQVRPLLASALARLPAEQTHQFNTYTARIFLAACHAQLGDFKRADLDLQLLAGDPRCPPELRQAAASQRAKLRPKKHP